MDPTSGPAQLRRLADEVTALASAVASASAVEWSSVAAEAFRERLAQEVARLRATAALIEDAAAALAAHAAAAHRPPTGRPPVTGRPPWTS